jgi:hypothetical protein
VKAALPGYAAVLAAAVAARALLSLLPVAYAVPGQRTVASWEFFALFVACFAAGAVLAIRAGLPSPGTALARAGGTLALPAAAGAAVGILIILSDLAAPAAAARGVATLHVAGPGTVPFYVYAAILLSTVFHFLPMALAAALARPLRGGARIALLGAAVALVAFSEDAGWFLREGLPLSIEGARHALSVAANAAEALFVLRGGLLGGLAQRATTYLVWHLLWPALGPG